MPFRVFFESSVIHQHYLYDSFAIAHQINVSPYSFIILLGFVGVIAALAVASDWSCRIRNVDTKDKLTN